MKKLMKVMALAVALCMLMSVSAFASTAVGDKNAKTIDIQIATGNGASEEVAVLIVKTGIAPANAVDGDIMYINQVSAVDGVYNLGPVSILNDAEVVDVYIGSATLGVATPVATGIDLKEVGESLTIVTSAKKTWANNELENVDVEGATGVAIKLGCKFDSAPVAMIWSFKEVGSTVRKYSSWISLEGIAAENTALELAAAFSNGTGDQQFNVDVVNVIVKTANNTYLFTDEEGDTANATGTKPGNN